MDTQHQIDETDIRLQIERLAEAIRAMDIDAMTTIYAEDVVSFDVEPPLQHLGVEAQCRNWAAVFAAYRAPLEYEIRDLAVFVGGDIAHAHSLNRLSGTLQDGSESGLWVRWTPCFRRIDGEWRIVHHQASVPIDVASGRARRDLTP